MASGDIERLKRGYEAFNEGGVEAVVDWLAPEIEVSDRQSVPDRETHHGIAGMRDLVDSIMDAFGELRLEPEEFIEASGGRVLAILRQTARGRASGIEVVGETAHLWTMRDGAPVHLRIFADRATAIRALGIESDGGDG